ncbi:uncharacterized protein LOC132282045 [Cornus florida]|uniref:uncharacterized protein LOC132282045 n=1 Tax=Cornus florida TaxID=4283 RepID=UPI00289CCF5B|nr:uncharacterized protein LOC132282045 [Cornus florida]
MVLLQSGLAAGEGEGLQASDAGTSTGQPPVVPNDQERVAALEQLVNQLVQQNAMILQRLAAPNEERNSEVPNNDSRRVNNDVELSQIGGQQRSHHHQSLERNTTRLRGDTSSYVGDKTEDATQFDIELQDLKAKVDDVMQAMKGKGQAAVNDMVQKTNLAFSPAVMSCPLPSKFKMPTLKSFDGTRDPLDHLETYKALMYLQAVLDEIMCRAFPTTLKGWARLWFNKLKPGSIENFEELSKQFIGHFIAGQKHRRPAIHLLNVKQQKGESLRDYISRFNTEMLQVEEVDDKVALTAFMGGLQTSKFLFSLLKEAPTSMTELMVRAWKHMNADDAMNARKNKDGEDKMSDKKRPAPSSREERELKYKKFSNNQADRLFRRLASPSRYNNYTPLNTSVEQVFLQIQDDASLKWPPKLKADPTKRSRDKYCRFHRDHGHNTEDCFDLKNQIENLVRKGHLRKFTTRNGK